MQPGIINEVLATELTVTLTSMVGCQVRDAQYKFYLIWRQPYFHVVFTSIWCRG